ncbi:MAG: hypothetical protein M3R43_00200 [Acidobacteriota bacterium]|nr:hypothetical protein [Acidobacteriota bacterium]
MIVVCDTTPISYLIQIELIDLIPRLFGTACLPSAVLHELQHPNAPTVVRSWVEALPSWVSIYRPGPIKSPLLLGLHIGEREALAIAEKLQADFVLTDDFKARKVAHQLGIDTLTTLLILDAAADRGWLDFQATLRLLLQTNFRVDQLTVDQLIEKHSRKTIAPDPTGR